MWAMTHLVGAPPRTKKYFLELPTRIRVSITSLQICKLVSLVTSRNRSRVSFLICQSFRDEASQESEHLTHNPLDMSQYTELKAFTQFYQSFVVLYKSKTMFLPFHKAFAQAGWCFGPDFQRQNCNSQVPLSLTVGPIWCRLWEFTCETQAQLSQNCVCLPVKHLSVEGNTV